MAGKIDGNNFKIPGLVQGKKDQNMAKLNEQEIQQVQRNFAEYIANKSQDISQTIGQVFPSSTTDTVVDLGLISTSDGSGGWILGYDPYNYKSAPPAQLPQKYTRTPPTILRRYEYENDSQKFIEEMIRKQKKSSFEEIIDEIFSTAEKEQFLIDIGYEFEKPDPNVLSTFPMDPIIKRKMVDGSYKVIRVSVEDLFLKEIMVKFKNLLLAKATLKMKF